MEGAFFACSFALLSRLTPFLLQQRRYLNPLPSPLLHLLPHVPRRHPHQGHTSDLPSTSSRLQVDVRPQRSRLLPPQLALTRHLKRRYERAESSQPGDRFANERNELWTAKRNGSKSLEDGATSNILPTPPSSLPPLHRSPHPPFRFQLAFHKPIRRRRFPQPLPKENGRLALPLISEPPSEGRDRLSSRRARAGTSVEDLAREQTFHGGAVACDSGVGGGGGGRGREKDLGGSSEGSGAVMGLTLFLSRLFVVDERIFFRCLLITVILRIDFVPRLAPFSRVGLLPLLLTKGRS